MIKRLARLVHIIAGSSLLFACAGEKLDLKVKVSMDGKPASQARVLVDNTDIGSTGEDGSLAKTIRKKPGAEVEVTVTKEMPGYRIRPWKGTFLMKLPKDGVDVYSFEAPLVAMRYVTIAATEGGAPVAEAGVRVFGKEAGSTDAKGEYIYEYKDMPAKGIDLAVSKSGYSTWRKTGPVEPGARLEATLTKQVAVQVTALVEEYGQASGIPGVSVSVNNKKVASTDAKGAATYAYDGEPGKKVQLTLSAPGYIPETWTASIILEGEVAIQRYFYPATPKPIRTGIYRFVGNTPNVDLKEVLAQTESAVAGQLFKKTCFREVPTKTLQSEMKRAGLSIDKAVTRGWRETPLRRTIDMLVLGSVAKDEKGFLIETKFYTAGGKLVLSQLTRAGDAGDINSAAKEIAALVFDRFPFEGTVVALDGERCRINLGKTDYRISRGTDFMLMAPRLDETGRISGYRETGRLRIKKTEENGSWAEAEELKKNEKIAVGNRVVRRVYREGEEEASRNYFILTAKGGVPPDVQPLSGVNIYVNDEWLGSTGADGTAEVPVRLGKGFTLVLYRHGYQQVAEKVKIEKNKDAKTFTLAVNNAVFKIESDPPAADVFVDDEKLGRTPILDGRPVPLGFHAVKVSIGGDYRDWEEVVEFSKKEEFRTGSAKVILPKDYLRIGERAEQKSDVDGAIRAYRSAEKGHPDYAEAHHRLAQIYLDEKEDFDNAIVEFENVLAMPENQQLVFKQYAVVFMNLGHAYYEKGNALVQKDQGAAAQNFGKAIQNLQTAKQNTRFFPNDSFDEALHDTYYYTALSYHKLYQITRKNNILDSANLAWREYFDFFPKNLEGKSTFEQARDAAQKYWDQIKNL